MKGLTDEGELAIFCSKCGMRFEDTVGKVRRLQEYETFDSDLYHVSNYTIDAGWFLMNMLEDSWDFCPCCGDEISL